MVAGNLSSALAAEFAVTIPQSDYIPLQVTEQAT